MFDMKEFVMRMKKIIITCTTGILGIVIQIGLVVSLPMLNLACNSAITTDNNGNGPVPVNGTVADIDGNVYTTVKIGTQEWTAENLMTTKYNDGTMIPKIINDTTWDSCSGAYCYYINTTKADSIKKFGALYNWYAVNTKKLAPIGWHVPSDTEWTILENYLVLHGYNWDGTTVGKKIAVSLASNTDWWSTAVKGTIGYKIEQNNSSGFSALPGGYRDNEGAFLGQGGYGNWWSATESDFGPNYAWYRYLSSDNDYLCRHGSYHSKRCGFSVRIVKDN